MPGRRATWLAMAVALAGIGTMVWEGFALGNPLGDLTALLATLGFAGFTVALRWGKTRDMRPAVCWATLLGGAIVLGALVGNALSGLRRWRPPIGTV